MELLLDHTHVRGLYRIISNIPQSCKRIRAAIAYNSESLLIDEVVKKGIRLDWWGLFDHTGATRYELVAKALKHHDLIQFFPVTGCFHAKLIHFDSYGLYIGSANMTHKALFDNVEAGVFFNEKDLADNGMDKMVDDFFGHLNRQTRAFTGDDLNKWRVWLESSQEPEVPSATDAGMEEEFADLFGDLASFHVRAEVGQPAGKKKSLRDISVATINIDPSRLADYHDDIADRARQQDMFDEIRDRLRDLVVRCANGELENLEFYEEMMALWSRHESRFQGSGFARTSKAADWNEICRSLVRVLAAAGEPDRLDVCVADEMDSLKENGNPARKAWLTEMLCHFWPDRYPLLDGPIYTWLHDNGYRLNKAAIDGTKYVELSGALRELVRNNHTLVRNLAELDIFMRYDSGD